MTRVRPAKCRLVGLCLLVLLVVVVVVAVVVFTGLDMCSCGSPGQCRLPTETGCTVVVQTFTEDTAVMQRLCTRVMETDRHHRVVLLEKGGHTGIQECDRLTRHTLPNTGREFGAFLWYVVHEYDRLDGVYIFTSGHLGKHNRMRRFEHLLTNGHQCFSTRNRFRTHPIACYGFFRIDSYMGDRLVPAEPRGFRRWFETFVGPWDRYRYTPSCFNGIFKTNAEYIHHRPKAFYQALLSQTEVHRSTEVVHYIEWATHAIFGPGDS
jgi:hypothetical protein